MKERKDVTGKIIQLGTIKNTKAGDIQPVDLLLDNGNAITVSVFLHGDKFLFGAGDMVDLSVQIGEYKGQKQYSTGVEYVTSHTKKALEQEKPTQSVSAQPVVDQSVWDAKDKRMVRMNALSHAVCVVDQEKFVALGEDTRAEMVIKIAEMFAGWIYG